jgi:hypothetical protein
VSLLGRAILAFTHDVTDEAEWTRWHDREHITERLAVPGFLRLRRYVALEPGPRLFYFYETESEAVLQSPAYLERLAHPTPWTRQCMQYVRNNTRTVCRVTATLGRGLGGAVAKLELGPGPGRADALRRWLAESALPEALARPGLVAAHLGEADAAATSVRTAEKGLLATPDALVRWLVILEGIDRDAVAAAGRDVLGSLAGQGAEGDILSGTYQLAVAVEARPAGRPDSRADAAR